MKKAVFFLSAILLSFSACSHENAHHGHSPYAGQEKQTVKAISDEDIQKYLDGDGLGLAKAAELNGFPGPKHVLENREKLSLTAEQEKRVEESFQKMKSEAIDLGKRIVDRERELDAFFAGERIDDQTLREKTREIAALQGDLRNVHLRAHLEMKRILSPDQVESYKQIRGYAN
ncbi:MAG: periplasmic heavy metal sensor [Pyrinomonadaceae bacterium]